MEKQRHSDTALRAQAHLDMLRHSLRAVYRPTPATGFESLLRALDR